MKDVDYCRIETLPLSLLTTSGLNFTNILHAAFAPTVLCQ